RIDEFFDTPVMVGTTRPVEGDQDRAGGDGLYLVILGDQIWIVLVGDARRYVVLLEGRHVWHIEKLEPPFRLDVGKRRQRHRARTRRWMEFAIAHGLDRVALCHRGL